MSKHDEILAAIGALEHKVDAGFRSVNKRLDGIEHELRKIDTVLHYTEKYENIPS